MNFIAILWYCISFVTFTRSSLEQLFTDALIYILCISSPTLLNAYLKSKLCYGTNFEEGLFWKRFASKEDSSYSRSRL